MSANKLDQLAAMPEVIGIQRRHLSAIARLAEPTDSEDAEVQRIIHGLLRDQLVCVYSTLSQLVEALTSTAYPRGSEGYRQREETLALIDDAATVVRESLRLALVVSRRIEKADEVTP